jgi:starch synthase (maltosyl-transferring)
VSKAEKSALQELVAHLQSMTEKHGECNYQVPGLWNHFNYSGTIIDNGDDKYSVNPYSFFLECIQNEILPGAEDGVNYHSSISLEKGENSGGDWIRESIIYGMMVRATTSYSHNGDTSIEPQNSDGYRETGTFLKTILLLPVLKKMGINTLYFLPITKYSNYKKKGELGSIYAAKNFFGIDPNLHDPICGGSDEDVDKDFKAFMEAAHIMGMRVVLDFIPRSCARDNELILEHPDWFYWIKTEVQDTYGPPQVPSCGFQIPDLTTLERMYSTPEVLDHISKFSWSPDKLDPEKWTKLVKKVKDEKIEAFVDLIAKEFGVITPPAFSDWLNDTQPPWDDVTFLRLYMSHPRDSVPYLKDPENQPPYIMHDIIKASNFPGEEKNQELWDTISDIMPHFQRDFGVDGVRVDMGHALPRELEKAIIDNARKVDPDFSFIAEEFVTDNDKKAKFSGYNILLGDLWWKEPRVSEGHFKNMLTEVLPKLELPVFGCSETPDTPRAMARDGGSKFSKISIALNAFMANSSPFINSGQEIFEIQPTNLGLDNSPEGRYMLPDDDPFNGKLAFFDYTAFHWNGAETCADYIGRIHAIRSRHQGQLNDISNYRQINQWENHNEFLGLAWILPEVKKALVVMANGRYNSDFGYHVNMGEICKDLDVKGKKIEVLVSSEDSLTELANTIDGNNSLSVNIPAGGVYVCLVGE